MTATGMIRVAVDALADHDRSRVGKWTAPASLICSPARLSLSVPQKEQHLRNFADTHMEEHLAMSGKCYGIPQPGAGGGHWPPRSS